MSDELGFNVAFGITDYDGISDMIEDETIGTMVAEFRNVEDVTVSTERIPIKHRLCRPEDFNLDEDWNYSEVQEPLLHLSEE